MIFVFSSSGAEILHETNRIDTTGKVDLHRWLQRAEDIVKQVEYLIPFVFNLDIEEGEKAEKSSSRNANHTRV